MHGRVCMLAVFKVPLDCNVLTRALFWHLKNSQHVDSLQVIVDSSFPGWEGESIWKYKVLSSIVFVIFLSGIHKVQPIAFSTKKCVTRRQKDTSDTLSTASRGVMPKEEAISSSTWELVQMMALLEARCRHEDRWTDVAIVAVINTPSWLARQLCRVSRYLQIFVTRPNVEVNLDILAGLQRLSTLCQPGLCFLLFAILSTEFPRGLFIRFKLESTLKALVEIETGQTGHFSRKNDVRDLKYKIDEHFETILSAAFEYRGPTNTMDMAVATPSAFVIPQGSVHSVPSVSTPSRSTFAPFAASRSHRASLRLDLTVGLVAAVCSWSARKRSAKSSTRVQMRSGKTGKQPQWPDRNRSWNLNSLKAKPLVIIQWYSGEYCNCVFETFSWIKHN